MFNPILDFKLLKIDANASLVKFKGCNHYKILLNTNNCYPQDKKRDLHVRSHDPRILTTKFVSRDALYVWWQLAAQARQFQGWTFNFLCISSPLQFVQFCLKTVAEGRYKKGHSFNYFLTWSPPEQAPLYSFGMFHVEYIQQ